MKLFYAVPLKKEGRITLLRPHKKSHTGCSGFGGVFSAGEAGSWAKFRANDFGVGARCRLRRRRRRGQFFRPPVARPPPFPLAVVNHFAFEQRLCDSFERFAILGQELL